MDHIGDLGSRQAHGLQLLIVAEHLPGCPIENLFPMVHDHQTGYVPGHVLHTVGHQDHRHALFGMEPCHQAQDIVPSFGVQSCCGFI